MSFEIKGKKFDAAPPLMAVPVMGATVEEVNEGMVEAAESIADVVEWRADYFPILTANGFDAERVSDILSDSAEILKDKVFIVTLRSKMQGGEFDGTERDALEFLDFVASSGKADLLDFEYCTFSENRSIIKKIHARGQKIIASHHDFSGTPDMEVMHHLLYRMATAGSEIVKLAVMPNDNKDLLNLLSVTDEFHSDFPDTPIITMSMGEKGMLSRISGEFFGSALSFASLAQASAPGQLSLADLKDSLEMIHRYRNK